MNGIDCIVAVRFNNGDEALTIGVSDLKAGRLRQKFFKETMGWKCNLAYVDNETHFIERDYDDKFGLDIIEVDKEYYITYFKQMKERIKQHGE